MIKNNDSLVPEHFSRNVEKSGIVPFNRNHIVPFYDEIVLLQIGFLQTSV